MERVSGIRPGEQPERPMSAGTDRDAAIIDDDCDVGSWVSLEEFKIPLRTPSPLGGGMAVEGAPLVREVPRGYRFPVVTALMDEETGRRAYYRRIDAPLGLQALKDWAAVEPDVMGLTIFVASNVLLFAIGYLSGY